MHAPAPVRRAAVALLLLSLAIPAAAHAAAPPAAPEARRGPALTTTVQAGGLTVPWDVRFAPRAGLLVGERDSARLLLVRGGTVSEIDFPSAQVWRSGETGLMGLEVDPRFRTNRRFYTCHGGFTRAGGHDVRVAAWRLSPDATTATRSRVLLRGIPVTTGRHGGCRLLVARNGALLVGTGDAASSAHPQDPRSLAGKVLRLNRWDGSPGPRNPWPRARNRHRRYVLTWGHRNVQGLAQRADGSLWSVEHGPDRNDEVNLLVAGGNYGWNPGPGYDENAPMTDWSLPGPQRGARWRSGSPTLATSGATFVRGEQWGALEGTLAVATLKTQRLLFLKLDRRGHLRWEQTYLPGQGRLRSVSRAPNNDLLLTTSNGAGADSVLRVSPR